MKTAFFQMLLCCFIVFSFSSCSKENLNEPAVNESTQTLEEIQMEELIQYVRDLTPSPIAVQSRGFWGRFVSWFKRIGTADAGAWKWAGDEGSRFGQRLRISITTSLVTAINPGGDGRMNWNINNEWKIYPMANREYQKAGNFHNQAIFELVRDHPNLKTGNISETQLLSMVETKVKSFGENEDLTPLQQAALTDLIRKLKSADDAEDIILAFSGGIFTGPTPGIDMEYEFLSEYLDGVLATNSREESISFTNQVYDKIDELSAVNQGTLKTMVSIALCSVNLWELK